MVKFMSLYYKILYNDTVASITRSGTTFTAKNSAGTQLFTFTQQDNDTYAWSSITGKPTTLSGYGITDGGIKNTVTQASKTTGNSANSFCNMCSLSVSAGTYLVLATLYQSSGFASNTIFGVSSNSTSLSNTNLSIKQVVDATGGLNAQVLGMMAYSSSGTIYALLYTGVTLSGWLTNIYAARLY